MIGKSFVERQIVALDGCYTGITDTERLVIDWTKKLKELLGCTIVL